MSPTGFNDGRSYVDPRGRRNFYAGIDPEPVNSFISGEGEPVYMSPTGFEPVSRA